jgi:hypothetical protein
MYMGHVSIVSTAYYLRWIPQLAAAASSRRTSATSSPEVPHEMPKT